MTGTGTGRDGRRGPDGARARARPESFRIEVHQEADGSVVVPFGELDLATVAELETTLRSVRSTSVGRVVLDLRELEFIDSAGIRLILTEDHSARSNGHEFVLIAGPPRVQRIIEITGIGERLRFRAP